MPTISIIVPVYNTEKYLHRCIDSILAQTYTDFELLLINDGSTDKSGAICDEYAAKDNRVRVFHKENGGVSSARNLGLDEAQGEWICFVDSDDYVFEEFLQNFISKIDDDVDLICQGMEFDDFFSKNCSIKRFGVDYHGSIDKGLLELYKKPMLGSLCNKCLKRIIIEKKSLRFYEDFNCREDEEYLLRYMTFCSTMCSVLNCGYFYFLPEWSVKYPKLNSPFLLFKSLYKSASLIYKGKITETRNKPAHILPLNLRQR